VQISHLTVLGKRNWGKVSAALERIDAAAARGADVAVDCYPYLAGSTNMTQMLPRWTLDGGNDALLERLGNTGERRRIGAELEAGRLQDWNGVLVVGGSLGTTADDLVGRSVEDIAAARGVPPAEAFLQVVEQSAGSAVMVAFGRSEEDLRAVLAHPRSMIGSDGLGLDPDGPSGGGMPHPRSYGCYPRLLGRYVRDLGALSLEAAVHKATFQVAERFGIPDRGLIAPGWIADLVVFDLARITDPATFTDPQQMAVGVEAVMVSGRLAVEGGTQSGELAGVVLRRRTGGQAI
jgi:N-acyl-D-aspartate/D-glutamate deacylase